MRIGAAQDMAAAGFDALAIMQGRRVESANVVLRYVEHAATRELHEKRWRSSGKLPVRSGSPCLVIMDERVSHRFEEVRWQEPVLVPVGLRHFP